MKYALPFLFLFFCACSGEPTKKEDYIATKPAHFDSLVSRAAQFKKQKEQLQVDVPYDTALITDENLQPYFRFVTNGRFIVLQLKADSLLTKGNPEMADMSFSPAAVTKELRMEKLADNLKIFIGKKFHMISSEGFEFDATISKIKFMFAFYEPYGEFEGAERDSAPTLEMARQIWEQGIGTNGMIVGEIDTTFSKDIHILGAVPAENAIPEIYMPSVNAHLNAQVEQDIRLTEQFRVIQKNYEQSEARTAQPGSWFDKSDRAFVYCTPNPKTAFYTHTLTAGEYCGGPFYAELFSAWEINSGKKEHLLFCLPLYCNTKMIMDLEGDGVPEFFTSDAQGFPMLFKKVDGRWQCVARMWFMDMRCPC